MKQLALSNVLDQETYSEMEVEPELKFQVEDELQFMGVPWIFGSFQTLIEGAIRETTRF